MKSESNAFRFEVAMVRHTVTLQCLCVGSPLHYSSQIQFQILAPSDLRMSRFRYSSFERNMMRLAAAFVGEDNNVMGRKELICWSEVDLSDDPYSRGDIFATAKMGRISGFWRFLGKSLGTGPKIPYWEPTGEIPRFSGLHLNLEDIHCLS